MFQVGITLFTVSHRKSLWKHHEVPLFNHSRTEAALLQANTDKSTKTLQLHLFIDTSTPKSCRNFTHKRGLNNGAVQLLYNYLYSNNNISSNSNNVFYFCCMYVIVLSAHGWSRNLRIRTHHCRHCPVRLINHSSVCVCVFSVTEEILPVSHRNFMCDGGCFGFLRGTLGTLHEWELNQKQSD